MALAAGARLLTIWSLAATALACKTITKPTLSAYGSSDRASSSVAGGTNLGCDASLRTESVCSDGRDDDCDGLVDCADDDCAGRSCGNGLSCSEAACRMSGLNTLRPMTNLTALVTGDSVGIGFLPETGAKDYRVWALLDPKAVEQRADGSLSVRGATYRCAGARPLAQVEAGTHGEIWEYERTEAEAVLGHAYPSPGPGRRPVFALGYPGPEFDDHDPTAIFQTTRMHLFLGDERERRSLIARGFRDDGVVFYVPVTGAERAVHWMLSERQAWVQDRRFGLLYNDGPERDVRKGQGAERTLFKLFSSPRPGTQPVFRVNYPTHAIHDELALGEAMKNRLLQQGNQPASLLHWSGLSQRTTLVVEALDRGCPFGGILAANDTEASGYARASKSPKTARTTNAAGELWINGQYARRGEPIPIARSFVTLEPKRVPEMDAYFDFLRTGTKQSYKLLDSDAGVSSYHLESDLFDLYFFNVEGSSRSIGEAFGELWVGYADLAADTNGKVRLTAKQMAAISRDGYLHVTAQMDIPSTMRRYPQLMVSTVAPPIQPALASGTTIIVQPFGTKTEIQLQVCKNRNWDVNDQCPQSPLGGLRKDAAGSQWPPQPVAAERSTFDYLARFDLFVSTERVYVYFERQPYGCGVLPKGTWQAGPVSVTLGDVLYHSGVDESVVCDDCAHRYLKQFSPTQTVRKFDNFGFSSGVSLPKAGEDLPEWNDRVMPCRTEPWEVY